MSKSFVLLIVFFSLFFGNVTFSQDILPVRGFCISAPKSAEVDAFVKFITDELVPRKVNILILRVDYNYQFESHPELRDESALSKTEVKKLVEAKKTGAEIAKALGISLPSVQNIKKALGLVKARA